MFYCLACNTNIGPHISPIKLVLETRSRVYPPRPLANDPGGHGVEIVREVNVCPTCVNNAKKGKS